MGWTGVIILLKMTYKTLLTSSSSVRILVKLNRGPLIIFLTDKIMLLTRIRDISEKFIVTNFRRKFPNGLPHSQKKILYKEYRYMLIFYYIFNILFLVCRAVIWGSKWFQSIYQTSPWNQPLCVYVYDCFFSEFSA